MKGVQCYELFGGIALKIHTFSFFNIKGVLSMYAPIVKCVMCECVMCECYMCVLSGRASGGTEFLPHYMSCVALLLSGSALLNVEVNKTD